MQSYLLLASLLFLLASPAAAQDWFRTGTGLGVEKPRVAVAESAPRSPSSQPLAQIFTDVLRADLEYAGTIEVVSKSMNPLQSPSVPAELKHAEWNAPPAAAHLLAFGNLSASGNDLVIEAWLSDVRNAQAQPVLGKRYRGEVTDAQIRRFAHQFADEIVSRLSGGMPGVAGTQIAFVSTRTGTKEIWAMDYDGSNQRPLTSLRTISLTPRWSPDGTRIAFTCYGPAGGVTSAQICLYSMETAKPMAFMRYKGTNSSPAWSPDGSKLMFMSSMHGDPELFMIDVTGGNLRRITYSAGVDTSPAWNPKTGQQIAFVSDRGGLPNLYLMNADGSSVEKLELPDMGYVIDPAWAPNGQLLAFSWRRPNGNYDLYVMDTATRQIVELTRDAGRNERPSWAPDGRHIVFESTRTGTRQIWTMLADGTQARQLTFEGHNESPNWSPH
ncbi:MAG: PD40 domain-containing protein [Acidobacteria bacterium]|nr:PD40 domain-containing protein [Acidobacteriota bacterium]MBI3662024.1 PD40 domain-containing protein [Acidobacteriota bacterium]